MVESQETDVTAKGQAASEVPVHSKVYQFIYEKTKPTKYDKKTE